MSKAVERLLVVATSGRALARSARRAGYAPVMLDAFADSDARAYAERCVDVGRGAKLDMSALAAAAREALASSRPPAVVYGAGLEAAPGFVDALAAQALVYGNSGAVLRLVSDPARFSALLGELDIAHPHTRLTPPTGEAPGWLIKRAGACGGAHVRAWDGAQEPSSGCYFQRRVAGSVVSALFLADGQRAAVMGYNALWTADDSGAAAFRYGGALNRAPLSKAQRAAIEAWIERLVARLGLKGLNGVDVVLSAQGPQLLELNARPCATFELYDPDFPAGLLAAHIEACRGRLPPAARLAPGRRGHAIVYAPHKVVIPSSVRWPDWCRDRPAGGTIIAAGHPVCSVLAEAASVRGARSLLATRRSHVLGGLVPASAAA